MAHTSTNKHRPKVKQEEQQLLQANHNSQTYPNIISNLINQGHPHPTYSSCPVWAGLGVGTYKVIGTWEMHRNKLGNKTIHSTGCIN